ncbi:hypothetical protein DSECCO2_542920 [anaerobic digester metagenome]
MIRMEFPMASPIRANERANTTRSPSEIFTPKTLSPEAIPLSSPLRGALIMSGRRVLSGHLPDKILPSLRAEPSFYRRSANRAAILPRGPATPPDWPAPPRIGTPPPGSSPLFSLVGWRYRPPVRVGGAGERPCAGRKRDVWGKVLGGGRRASCGPGEISCRRSIRERNRAHPDAP